jgi:effector-binding domain-containing protein
VNHVHIIDLKPHAGAGLEAFVRWADVGSAIRRTFDRLYGPGALNPGHGHNFILYQNETREGAMLLIGVLDRDPGGGDPDVKAVHVPGGRVITAPHWGDYASMPATYGRIHDEMKARKLRRAPMSLEIYGDWDDDPAKVKTDLHIYLGVAI